MGCMAKVLTLMLVMIFLMPLAIISYGVPVYGLQTWNTQFIDKTDLSGFIALDSNNNPHIVYNDFSMDLMYATLNKSEWDIQTVSSQYYALAFLIDYFLHLPAPDGFTTRGR